VPEVRKLEEDDSAFGVCSAGERRQIFGRAIISAQFRRRLLRWRLRLPLSGGSWRREATMAMSRQQARIEHTASTAVATGTGHDQFTETIYGVICSTCHNYISIDKTNCPSNCREHESCRQAYA
jgi:hypothetical protein